MRSLHRSRRSPWWFALIVVPVLLGVGGAVQSARRLGATIDAMVRVEVPGTREVDLPAGDLTIYAEGRVDNLSCTLADASGSPIALHRPNGNTSYTWGGRHGEAVLDFTSPHAGRYVLTCTPGEDTRFFTRFAIGRGLGWPIVGLVASLLGGLFGAGLTGVGVWLWRRRGATSPMGVI